MSSEANVNVQYDNMIIEVRVLCCIMVNSLAVGENRDKVRCCWAWKNLNWTD